jgi:hypothetical protein
MKNWTSTKAKFPEIGKIVIVTLKHKKNDVYAGFRANGGWYIFTIGENHKHFIPNKTPDVEITHWMELPDAPIHYDDVEEVQF